MLSCFAETFLIHSKLLSLEPSSTNNALANTEELLKYAKKLRRKPFYIAFFIINRNDYGQLIRFQIINTFWIYTTLFAF